MTTDEVAARIDALVEQIRSELMEIIGLARQVPGPGEDEDE